ncbi:bifunctional methylenetetrahydrofolate dehydrogenase/methenyltetrahydrofolate cyclohydrolase FolD [Flavobacteriaceae bacterium Ap0902]|nr:bifunctional methylenetetrahydrofolate dehydrogenase/methenyltetrahydrofolate cyclohydrolase FolD [Flavobacteriaceae bacterium Ap0902]
MQILDGNKLSKKIREEIKQEVDAILDADKRAPHLAAVLVGEDPASQSYVRNKIKDCEAVGFKSTLHRLSSDISEEELLDLIEKLNTEKDLDGFIVQLPLPKHIDQERVTMAINPDRDVDGFHPTNFGKMALDMDAFLPATPAGIMEMLERYNIDTKGKHCVIIGRSHIVGRPMSILMGRKTTPGNSTVTLCHSATPHVEEFTKEADIIITALGVPNFLKEEMVKEGAVVIDVGISRVEDDSTKKGYKLVGDVDYENVKDKTSYITPVPGGVGPMTRSMLLKNTLLSYKRNK